MEKDMSNRDKKKVGIAMQISDKVEFETFIKREGRYLVMKGSIQEENLHSLILCTQYRRT